MTTSRPQDPNPSLEHSPLPKLRSVTGRAGAPRSGSSSAKAPAPPWLPPGWPPVDQQPTQLPPPQYGLRVPPPQFGRFSPSHHFSHHDRRARQISTSPANPGALPAPPAASLAIIGAARIPGPLAGFGTRAVSFLIDCVAPVIALSLLLPIAAVAGGTGRLVIDAMASLGVLGFGICNCGYLQGTTGSSLGRRVTGTKLVSIATGQPVGFGRALTRQICHVLDFGIGYLRPLWNGKRQTFADQIVGTIVVHVGQPTKEYNIMNHRRLGE